MAASPVSVLAIIAIYVAFFALFQGATSINSDLDEPQDINQPDSLLNIIGGILDTIWSFIQVLLNALIFNVEGAPFYVQFPVAVIIISSLTWSIVTLIRGN